VPLSPLQYLIGVIAGALVSLALALTGGGGSILAVPLIVYAVGVRDPHIAVGTSALAVAANAAINACNHARAGAVRWKIAAVFASSGIVGAWCGSLAGRAMAGDKLLACFGVLMLGVAAMMFRRASRSTPPIPRNKSASPLGLPVVGLLTGALSGFFGIGGGFLIVPGLVYAARLEMLQAIATSLVAVAAFGLTTALSYARSGAIDWPLAACFIGGGILGGLGGAQLARHLSMRRGALDRLFACMLLLVAAYVLYRSASAFA
jgi:uncharacterized membrane protein YfcA